MITGLFAGKTFDLLWDPLAVNNIIVMTTVAAPNCWEECISFRERALITAEGIITHTLPKSAFFEGIELVHNRTGTTPSKLSSILDFPSSQNSSATTYLHPNRAIGALGSLLFVRRRHRKQLVFIDIVHVNKFSLSSVSPHAMPPLFPRMSSISRCWMMTGCHNGPEESGMLRARACHIGTVAFTLVEIAISLGIFTFCILAIASLLLSGLSTERNSAEEQGAAALLASLNLCVEHSISQE